MSSPYIIKNFFSVSGLVLEPFIDLGKYINLSKHQNSRKPLKGRGRFDYKIFKCLYITMVVNKIRQQKIK